MSRSSYFPTILILFLVSFIDFTLNSKMQNVISFHQEAKLSNYFYINKIDYYKENRQIFEFKNSEYSQEEYQTVEYRNSLKRDVIEEYKVTKIVEQNDQYNQTLVEEHDYWVNSIYSDRLFSRVENSKEYFNNPKLEIKITQPEAVLDFHYLYGNIKLGELTHVVSVGNYIIGLLKGKVNLYSLTFPSKSETALNQIGVREYLYTKDINELPNRTFKSLHLASNFEKQVLYVLFVDINDAYTLFSYNLQSTEKNKFTYMFTLRVHSNGAKIVDFVYNVTNKKMIVAYENSIMAFNADPLQTTISINLVLDQFQNHREETKALNILDLQEADELVYVLIKNFGIKILYTLQLDQNKLFFIDVSFYHPHLTKLIAYENPSFKNKFIGAIVNSYNEEPICEFFYEFIISFERYGINFQLFRTYMTMNNLDIQNVSQNGNFIYLHHKYPRESIIVINKLNAGFSPNSVFTYYLNGESFSLMSFINDNLFLYSNTAIVHSKESFMSSAEINIYFNQIGHYEVSLQSYRIIDQIYLKEFSKLRSNFKIDYISFHLKSKNYIISLIFIWIAFNILCYVIWIKRKQVKQIDVNYKMAHNISKSSEVSDTKNNFSHIYAKEIPKNFPHNVEGVETVNQEDHTGRSPESKEIQLSVE